MTIRSQTTDYPHAEPVHEHEEARRVAAVKLRQPRWHDDEAADPLAALGLFRARRPWQAEAACAGKPGDWWFPLRSTKPLRGRSDPYRHARPVCAACPVSADCLADAVERGEQWGMWGGLTPEERRALVRAS